MRFSNFIFGLALLLLGLTAGAQTLTTGVGKAGGGGGSADPFFGNVVLLAQGSNSLVDASNSLHGSPVFNGTGGFKAALSTVQEKFATPTLRTFASGTPGGITWSSSTDWALGTGAFTIEAWIYPNNLTGTQQIIGVWNTSVPFSWILFVNISTLSFNVSTTGSNNIVVVSGGSLTINTWHHVVVGYDGTTYRLGLDGTFVGTSTTAESIFNASTTLLSIDQEAGNSQFWFDNYSDQYRITKGVWRYGTGAGYTVPTQPFPTH